MKNITKAKETLEQVSEEIIKIETENQWYSHYRNQQQTRIKDNLEILLKQISNQARVLDVGVNPPFLLSSLATLGFDSMGLDLSPESFEKTIKKFDLKVYKVNIEEEKFPFDDNHFDAVIFTEVFEHLRINPVFTLSEVYRILAPGGFLLLSTPNLYSLKGIFNFLFRGKAYACALNVFDELNHINESVFSGHVREYTWQEVKLFLERIGFAEIKTIYRGGTSKYFWTLPFYLIAPSLKPQVMFLCTKGNQLTT